MLIIILAVIPFLTLGNTIIPDSMIELHVAPINYLYRLLFSWDSQWFAGYNSGWNSAYLPVAAIYALLEKLSLPDFVWGRIWFIIIFSFAGLSLYYCTEMFNIKSNSAKVIASVSYMYSLYMLIQIVGASTMLLSYASLPLLLFIYEKGFETHKYFKYAIMLSFSINLMTGINPPLIIINAIVLFIYLCVRIILSKEKCNYVEVVKYNLYIICFSVLLNLWWIAPFVYQISHTWLAGILSEPPTMHNMKSSYLEVFRQLGFWGFYSTNDKGVPYFSYYKLYTQNPIFIITTLSIPILSVSVLLLKKINYKIIFIFILMVISLPMVVGIYPSPTAKLYEWCYYHIPYFQMFRATNKFLIPISFSYVILLGIFTDNMLELISKRNMFKKIDSLYFKKLLVILLFGVIFINFYPGLSGKIFRPGYGYMAIPQYWFDAAKYLNLDRGNFRVLLFPDQYFPEYEWGFTYGEIATPLIDHSLISQVPGNYPSPFTEKKVYDIYNDMIEGKNIDLENELSDLNVKYILQRNDFYWEDGNKKDPSYMKNWLSHQQYIKYVKSFGQLDLYEVNNNQLRSLVYGETYLPITIKSK